MGLGQRLESDDHGVPPSATAHRLPPVSLDATHQSVDLQVAGGQAERCGCW